MDLPCGTFNENYNQEMAIVRTRHQWFLLVALLIILFVVPPLLGGKLLGWLSMLGITTIAILGLNILTGYCGQISIGHSAFVAVGAYCYGILYSDFGFPLWLGIPCAALMAGFIGLVFGLPSFKIKGFYLIMATLASQFVIIFLIVQLRDLTGGPEGLILPSSQDDGLFDHEMRSYFLIAGMTVLMTFLAKNLTRTKAGRAFIAIRDNDTAAKVMGINITGYKLLGFFVGCAFAGVAGSLWAYHTRVLHPDAFTLTQSIWYLGMLIVGGLGTILGAILGAIFFALLNELILAVGPAIQEVAPAFGGGTVAGLTLLAYGLAIALFLILEARGLAHVWENIKSSYRVWPFSY